MASTHSRTCVGVIAGMCVLMLALGAQHVTSHDVPEKIPNMTHDGNDTMGGNGSSDTKANTQSRQDETGGDGVPVDGEESATFATDTDWAYEDLIGNEMTVAAGDVPTVACDLVAGYRDEGDCLLRHAGYLDLLGNVWGCVVQGPGWVDVCVVSQGENVSQSVVRVRRLGADT